MRKVARAESTHDCTSSYRSFPTEGAELSIFEEVLVDHPTPYEATQLDDAIRECIEETPREKDCYDDQYGECNSSAVLSLGKEFF